MNYSQLENLSCQELKEISEKMDIKPRHNKRKMLDEIIKAFKEYENYKKNKNR